MADEEPAGRRPRPCARPRPSSRPRPCSRPRPDSASRQPSPSSPELLPPRRALLLVAATGVVALAGLTPPDGLVARAAASARRTAGAVVPDGGRLGVTATGTPAVRSHLTRGATSAMHRQRLRSPIRSLDDLALEGVGARPVMLTLDDGPHAEWTPRLLDLLDRTGITATFFMIGSQAHPRPDLVREVAARGHVIGNHTWSHDEFLTLRPVAQIRAEIDRTSHAIHAASGVVPTQFRAPGGNWGPRLLDVLAEQQLAPVGWDVDPRDWSRPGTRSIESTLLRIRGHDIALCHDGGGDRGQTLRALARVLPRLQSQGYTFVTLPRS